jgi:hypothetical protein
MSRLGLVRLWLVVGLVLVASSAHAGWARYALVIGYNDSDDSNLKRLRYADDDALKYSELFSFVGDKTILLAKTDKDTRRMMGKRSMRAPTRANVLHALKSLRAQMALAVARGDKPILYFVYSGHGNYDKAGRGYVHLADGRWTTRDLYYHVLGPSQSGIKHHVVLIVDACNAALLVNSRGSTLRRSRGTSLKLENYPNVGLILSSSSVGEVHEWGRYLSGIFSHEVRSGLLGPADLNDDRKISFAEIAAFVRAANAEVKNANYRVKPYIRPPLTAPNMPIVSLRKARFPAMVRVGPEFRGRAHLLNSELIRYVDFNKSHGQGFWLGVPGHGSFALVHGNTEYIVPAGSRGKLKLAELTRRSRTQISARGVSAYFDKRLFARPFGRKDAQKWLMNDYTTDLVVERFEVVAWYENKGAWTLLGGGLAALSSAVTMHTLAFGAHDDATTAIHARDRQRFNALASRNETIAGALYGVGGAAVVGSILWFALDESYRITRYQPPIRVQLTPMGIQLKAKF